VYGDETRPVLQGSRLTAWELAYEGIPYSLITDSMAASMMQAGRVQAVIVGADRIAANGDAANKIGTYPLAIVARHHDVPFYVAAPWTTVDLSLASGDEIPIEERNADEGPTSPQFWPKPGRSSQAYDESVVDDRADLRGLARRRHPHHRLGRSRPTTARRPCGAEGPSARR
jgi:hypothetical protein